MAEETNQEEEPVEDEGTGEVAGETGPAIDECGLRHLKHRAVADGIAYDYPPAMQVHAAVFSHISGEGTFARVAGVIPGAVERPARPPAGGELHLSGGGWSHALGGAAVGEEAVAPGAGNPHELGVVDDVEPSLGIEADDPGAEDVVAGVSEVDGVLELAFADVHGEAEARAVIGFFPRGFGTQPWSQDD